MKNKFGNHLRLIHTVKIRCLNILDGVAGGVDACIIWNIGVKPVACDADGVAADGVICDFIGDKAGDTFWARAAHFAWLSGVVDGPEITIFYY